MMSKCVECRGCSAKLTRKFRKKYSVDRHGHSMCVRCPCAVCVSVCRVCVSVVIAVIMIVTIVITVITITITITLSLSSILIFCFHSRHNLFCSCYCKRQSAHRKSLLGIHVIVISDIIVILIIFVMNNIIITITPSD